MEIAVYGHPVLRKRAEAVKEVTTEIAELARRMTVTMFENETRGIGLAAPQVGVSLRLVTLAVYDDPDEIPIDATPGERFLCSIMPCALVNPEVTVMPGNTDRVSEGCLSVPGVSEEVVRPTTVLLRSALLDGQVIETICTGLLARCLQHEVDHLDGILFVDRIDDEALARAMPQLKVLEKKAARQVRRMARKQGVGLTAT